MSATKKSADKQLTAQEALSILASAIDYCQKAGLVVRAGNVPNLVLSIDGALVQDGAFVPANVTELTSTPELA
jgi:hypothetical protein